jgi:hypothetical protein
MSTIIVKVIRVPGAVVEVGLESGATVADALDAAEITLGDNEAVTINGETANTSSIVTDGTRIVLAKAAKSA